MAATRTTFPHGISVKSHEVWTPLYIRLHSQHAPALPRPRLKNLPDTDPKAQYCRPTDKAIALWSGTRDTSKVKVLVRLWFRLVWPPPQLNECEECPPVFRPPTAVCAGQLLLTYCGRGNMQFDRGRFVTVTTVTWRDIPRAINSSAKSPGLSRKIPKRLRAELANQRG